MTTQRAPSGLGSRGRRLWREMWELTTFNPAERVLLEEACRIADRLEKLDDLLTGTAVDWIRLVESKGNPDRQEIVIDNALSESRQQANQLKQLVAALRLPDEKTGARPQQRGGARGAYAPAGKKPATVTALEKLRQASGG